MPAIKYVVDLSSDEREQLLQLIRRGKPPARKVTRTRILLKADKCLHDEEIPTPYTPAELPSNALGSGLWKGA